MKDSENLKTVIEEPGQAQHSINVMEGSDFVEDFLLGGANSTLLVSPINTLLTYLQVNSSLVFTSHDTIA